MLELEGFASEEQWVARQRSRPRWLGGGLPQKDNGVKGMLVHFKPRVDKRRFLLKLQELMGGLRREDNADGETSTDSAPAMRILRIKAFLCLSDEGTVAEQHYEFDAMGTRTRWTPKSGSLDSPFNPTLCCVPRPVRPRCVESGVV